MTRELGSTANRMNDIVIFTGADARYFHMCLGLVLSLLRVAPTRPRIRVLDLGLTPLQVQTLEPLVEKILAPKWYAGARCDLPLGFRGGQAPASLARFLA